MFERLVKNNFPYTLLMRQSRMHPQFVKLFSYHYSEQRKEAGQIKSSKVQYNVTAYDELFIHVLPTLDYVHLRGFSDENILKLYNG